MYNFLLCKMLKRLLDSIYDCDYTMDNVRDEINLWKVTLTMSKTSNKKSALWGILLAVAAF